MRFVRALTEPSRAMTERDAMARALELAWRGWGRVQPNPLVGAVVLAGGEVVGEGWHAEFGERHAEPVALAAAGDAGPRGDRWSCTLEPCAHQGKQPPCTEALLAAGVRRVVAARGGSRIRWRPAAPRGSARRASRWSSACSPARPRPRTPSSSTRSATARDPTSRSSSPPRSTAASPTPTATRAGSRRSRRADFVHWLRAGFDAVAVGGVTARADDPSLTVRGPLLPRVRAAAGRVRRRRRRADRRSAWSARRARRRPRSSRRRSRQPRAAGAARGRWRRHRARPAALVEALRDAARGRRDVAAGGGRRTARRRAARGGPGGPLLLGADARSGSASSAVPAVAGLPDDAARPGRSAGASSSAARWATTRCSCWTGADVHRHRHRRRSGPPPRRAASGGLELTIALPLRGARAGREHRGRRGLPHGPGGRSRRVHGLTSYDTSLERTNFGTYEVGRTGESRARPPGRRPARRTPGAGPCGRRGRRSSGWRSARTRGCSTSGCRRRWRGSRCRSARSRSTA